MFLKKTPLAKGTFLQIVESFYDNGISRQKVIEKIGYLEALQETMDDPIAFYTEKAKQMTLDKTNKKNTKLSINLNDTLSTSTSLTYNIGYCVFKEIYKELKIDLFWKGIAKKYSIQYDLESIFRLLIFSRILMPGSKKRTFDNKSFFFEKFDFSLNDVYRSLDIICKSEKALQTWIYENSKDKYSRDLSCTYFDCTNFYFEIETNDTDLIDEDGNVIEKGYRKRGPEKNNRPDPIIEMGLLMDNTGIPLSYHLFPGNESEKLQLRPILKQSRTCFGAERTIVVADRGLNTSDNMYFLAGKNDVEDNQRDGYVYGQSIRGADTEFKKWVLQQTDYRTTKLEEEGSTIAFKHKSRIYPKQIYIKRETTSGKEKKQKISIDQKQMVYYSEKYAKRQRAARNQMIEKAQDLIKHPKKYDRVSAKGTAGYILNLNFNKESGEIIDKDLVLDERKIIEEAKYDGYYSIVTSELTMDDIKLRNVYRGLAKIEDTFKVTKTELESRPVYVWTKESIEAHFLTCFTSLVILRLLQNRLNNRYSPSKIIHSLKKYNCVDLGSNTYMMTHYDELLKDCSTEFNLHLEKKYRSRRELKHLLKY